MDRHLTVKVKMRIARISIFSFILIIFAGSQLSADLYSPDRDALSRILRKLKFRVTEISAAKPAHLDRYDVLLLHDIAKAPTETEVQEIKNFVNTGGTLIVAGENQALGQLYSAFGLELQALTKKLWHSRRIPAEPLFPEYPVDEVYTGTDSAITPLAREVDLLYGKENNAVIVTLRDGEGRAYFIASDDLFSRYWLLDSGNAVFLYNLMSTFPHNARVGLAVRRYYTIETKPPNPFVEFVFRTPGGLGATYICLMLFLFLVLRGRRFGKPLDAQGQNRRLSAEYVHAMTALYQKGNTRLEILRHIRERFKADLGVRWRVNPNLGTSTFLEELALRGAVDEDDELTNLMADLDSFVNISETRLLDIAQRVEAYRETEKIGRTKLTAGQSF